MSMTQLLFSFQGRLNRKPYWLTNIAVGIGAVVLVALALVMLGEHKFAEAFATMALVAILYIPLLWVSLALGAKRLHDRNKSAWWLVLFYVAPGVASGIGDQTEYLGFVLHLGGFAITSGALSSSPVCAERGGQTIWSLPRWVLLSWFPPLTRVPRLLCFTPPQTPHYK